MSRLIAIGDIHGCYYTLINLLDKIKYNKERDTIVFLGDYIDRGKNSYEVVDFLISLQKEVGKDRCICLKGNHEDMALNDHDTWKYNGSDKTKKSYYKHGSKISKHYWWFDSLPLYYETDKYIFCHAGLTHPKLEDNLDSDFLWNRGWMTKDLKYEKQIVFGHTPINGAPYFTTNGCLCIDAGCVFEHNLCCVIIEGDEMSVYLENKSKLD